MTDVNAKGGTSRDQKALPKDRAVAGMRWEGVPPVALFKDNTAAFVHDLAPDSLSNVSGDDNYVRVQILTPVGALDRATQLAVVKELTNIAAAAAGAPALPEQTWALVADRPNGESG